jgi:hypothetical protein
MKEEDSFKIDTLYVTKSYEIKLLRIYIFNQLIMKNTN